MMLKRIIWHDLRWRLLPAAILVGMTAGVIVLGLRLPARADYVQHLDLAWFNLPGASAVLLPAALIVGSPGTLVRPSRDVAYVMTLPVSRERWVMSHIGAAVAALTLLLIACDLLFVVAGVTQDSIIRVGPLLARSLLLLAAAAAWIPLMVSLTALVRRPIVAVPLAFVLLSFTRANRFRLDIPAEPHKVMLAAMDPWAFADPRAWNGSIPFASIATAIAMAVTGMLVALFLIRRRDM
jgi:hypothetical protein